MGRLPRRLQNLIDGLADTATGAELRLREELLRSMPPRRPAPGELEATLGAFRWFLDTAAGDGLPLTAAGYLSPSAVQQACRVLPRHPHLDGAPDNREAHTPTVRRFRQSLCAVGLLEQRGSRLVLTEAGAAAQAEPQTLWEALRAALPAGRRFQKDATLLLLLEAATSPGQSLSLEATAWVLNRIGWRIDEQPLTGADLAGLPAVEILGNLTPGPAPANDDDLYISTTASLLAHEALMGRRP